MSYEVVRLGDVADIVTGNTPSKSNDEFWFNGIIPFVTPGELKYNSTNYVESASDNVTELALSAARVIPKNSVMVCCIGSLGKLGIASRDLITNQQINSVIFKKEVAHYKFGYYAISLLRNEMEKIAPSTTVKIINKTLFSNLQIPLPPLDIQKKIADTLDKAQELIDKRKEQISALDKFLENLFLEMFGDPRTNSKNLDFLNIESISVKITDGEHSTPKRVESGYYLLSARNIKNGYLDFNAGVDYIAEDEYTKISKRCNPQINDILISCSGSIGRVTRLKTELKFGLVRSVALVKLNLLLVNPIYVEYWLRTDFMNWQMNNKSKSSSQANLFLTAIKSLDFLMPPLDLQNQFASIVEKVEAEKTKLEASLKEMEDNFNSIMQRAFKGELF